MERGCSDIDDQGQNGTEARVFVWTPPKLASSALLSAYNWGLKGFHFGDLLFYSLFLSILSKNGHKLSEILKIGSKIKVHQNENPLNPSYKHSKVHYLPILMVFRQKLWPQSHFGPGRRYPISPFISESAQVGNVLQQNMSSTKITGLVGSTICNLRY